MSSTLTIKRVARARKPDPTVAQPASVLRLLPVERESFVNDVHSRLNHTSVRSILQPASTANLQAIIKRARAAGQSVSIAGGRHAMGGQQFATQGVLLDMSRMNRVLELDAENHCVEVEAGIQWPELIHHLVEAQRGSASALSIIQKQTGADALSLGGALAANIHGRGLKLQPIIKDVESFILVNGEGEALNCSRHENSELFGLAIGGYGLFGVIARVTLRLRARRKLQRVVRLRDLSGLMPAFEERISDGFLYGDFQFMTDSSADGFLRQGVFSCYRPVADDTPAKSSGRELAPDDWQQLLYLAHADRKRAFELYSAHYLATDGQLNWSDTHQLSVYLDDYHSELDARLGAEARGSEMITELYLPREKLVAFMEAARADFLAHQTELIYGTIRLIEKDEESFLAWAKEPYACVVFNLHVTHTEAGIEKSRADFQRLIDRAIEFGGSYYLTYHRWATREQVLSCYPQLPEFLRLKRKYDEAETFQSDWYRHYKMMFPEAV